MRDIIPKPLHRQMDALLFGPRLPFDGIPIAAAVWQNRQPIYNQIEPFWADIGLALWKDRDYSLDVVFLWRNSAVVTQSAIAIMPPIAGAWPIKLDPE